MHTFPGTNVNILNVFFLIIQFHNFQGIEPTKYIIL